MGETQAREGEACPSLLSQLLAEFSPAPGPPPPTARHFSVAPTFAPRVTSLLPPLPFPAISTTFCFLVQMVMVLLLHCSFLPNRSLRTVQVSSKGYYPPSIFLNHTLLLKCSHFLCEIWP